VRKAQFRVEFLNQVVMDCVFYAMHILSFEFLFRFTGSIAGWSAPEVRVFLGCLFASDAFSMVWLGQCWMFGEDLKNGSLDPVRVRPASPAFLYFFQRFSLEGTVNMAIALAYLSYALAAAGLLSLPWTVVIVAWALAMSFWARSVLAVLYSIVEFWLVSSDLSRTLHHVFMEITDRPLDVFQDRVRQFLLFLVPAGALCFVPAQLIVGRASVLEGLGYSAFLALFGWATFRAWNRSFRHYESALS
jgi:ABC-type uncharacterized transport system permease subunit